jgi:hypothetical protein
MRNTINSVDVSKDIQSNIGSDIHNKANASDDPIATMNDLNFGETPPNSADNVKTPVTPVPTDTSADDFVQDEKGEWQQNIAKESLQPSSTINTPRYSFLRGL